MGFDDIAATSFLTLYCHALETLSKNPLLTDPKSVEIFTIELNKILSRSTNPLDRILTSGNLDRRLIILPSAQKNMMNTSGISYRSTRTALLSISVVGSIPVSSEPITGVLPFMIF